MKNRKNYVLLIISTLMMILFVTASVNAEEIHQGKSPAAAAHVRNRHPQAKKSFAKTVIRSVYNGKDGMYIKIKKRNDVDSYDIYRYCKESKQTEYVGSMYGNETLFLDTEVKYKWGKTYSYYVYAEAFGYDYYFSTSDKMTAVRIPSVKYTYKSAKSSSQIQIKWKSIANYNNFSGYEIQYAKSQSNLSNKTGSYRVRTINSKSVTSQTFSGLSANTTYYFRIRAFKTIKAGDKWKRCYTPYTATAKIKTHSKVPKYRALVIGNYEYSGNTKDLRGPRYDAIAMAGTLEKYHYTTTKKTNRTASQILSSIRSTFSGASSNDISLFFYSGHGSTYGSMAYLCGADNSYVSMSELASALKKIPGKIIVVLNGCYSGNAIAKDFNNGDAQETGPFTFDEAAVNAFAMADGNGSYTKNGELRNSKFLVLAGGAKGEETSETYYLNNSFAWSWFPRAFVEGAGCAFSSGSFSGNIPCDTNHDKKISLKEMYVYTRRKVVEVSSDKQHVTCYPYGSTSLIMKK